SREAPTQQARERRLARLQRLAPEILAVELEQVERKQEDTGIRAPIPETIKRRQPVVTTGDCLPVNQEGTHPQRAGSLGDQRVPVGPVVPVAGEQPDAGDVAPDHHAESVVLDLVNPAGAGWRAVGAGWQAGRNEGVRGSTQYHAGGNIGCHSRCPISPGRAAPISSAPSPNADGAVVSRIMKAAAAA